MPVPSVRMSSASRTLAASIPGPVVIIFAANWSLIIPAAANSVSRRARAFDCGFSVVCVGWTGAWESSSRDVGQAEDTKKDALKGGRRAALVMLACRKGLVQLCACTYSAIEDSEPAVALALSYGFLKEGLGRWQCESIVDDELVRSHVIRLDAQCKELAAQLDIEGI